jgi:geranylgeranyl pyrophosphate synthase
MQKPQPSAETAQPLSKLAEYKGLIDADISAYSERLMRQWTKDYGVYSRDSMHEYVSLLSRGGKRLRGALVMAAYEMHGGSDRQLSVAAARIIEMIHTYVLIIDDIADHSSLRRGGPAVHIALEQYHREHKLHGDSVHFGTGIAMHTALAGAHLALSELGKLPIDDTTKLEAMNNLNDHMVVTINGQFNDIFNEALQDIDEADVRKVLTWKTAYYSFLNPLQFGAILAGANATELDALTDYSINAGLSFQIVDDILGTFGDTSRSGKSAHEDIREGKITILVSRALARATPEQKRFLLAALGNQDLSVDDYNECKVIIEETGALDYARELAKSYAAKAVSALDTAPPSWSGEHVEFLRALATYITTRSH